MAAVGQKRPRGAAKELSVYICEYHDEALRCLHHAIRRRRMPFSGLTMVHLDAHPDLSASAAVPADIVFESPSELYHLMRKEAGGIAQWILPSVYGGHFNCLWWVRPGWAHQIRDGDYAVAVGKAVRAPERPVPEGAPNLVLPTPTPAGPTGPNAGAGAPSAAPSEPPETIRISCPEPYFVDDGTYCPEADLKGSKPLRLLVSELQAEPSATLALDGAAGVDEGKAPGTAWTLDVCLDFFACGNPFLRHARPRIAEAFTAVQNAATFRQTAVSDVEGYLEARDAFDVAYGRLLRKRIAQPEAPLDEELLEAIGEALPECKRDELLDNLESALEEGQVGELQEILEAADMITLPLHKVTEAEVDERLREFDVFVGRLCADSGLSSSPAAVTIARSVTDGFCPMRWQYKLEQAVLDVLRRRFGSIDVLYSDELDALEHPA